MKYVDDCVARIAEIYQKASDRLEALKVGERITTTDMAEDIAKEYGMTGSAIYPTLLLLVRGYPGIENRAGRKGGLYKIAPSANEAEIVPMPNEVAEPYLDMQDDDELPIINT